jgi:hypothetical protein
MTVPWINPCFVRLVLLSFIYIICVRLHIVVYNTYCVVFLFCFSTIFLWYRGFNDTIGFAFRAIAHA